MAGPERPATADVELRLYNCLPLLTEFRVDDGLSGAVAATALVHGGDQLVPSDRGAL